MDDDELRELDPDWDEVPDELRQRDGQTLKIEGVDRVTGERVVETGALVISPGDFGDAKRRQEDDDADNCRE